MKIILTFIITLLSFPAFAEDPYITPDQKKQVYGTANIFGQCAGFWKAVSHLAKQMETPETAMEFGNRANGWNIAGAYLLHSTGAIESWKAANSYEQKIVDSAEQSFKAQIELGDKDKAVQFYKDNCEQWAEYQLELVTQLRQQVAEIEAKE